MPKAAPNAAKLESVESLKQRLDGVRSAVLTEYRGLTVSQLSELRKQLKGARAEYKVVKNRLARIAVEGSPLGALAGHLKGPLAVAYTREDPVAVARALQAFVRTNPALTIKLGLVDGAVVQPDEIKSLAELPSKEALRGQLVGVLTGPLAQLASLLAAPHRELVHVLAARGEGAAAPGEPSASEPRDG